MKRTAFGVAILLLACGPAFAQDQTPQDSGQSPDQGHHGQGFRAACGSDLQTFCASAQSREDRHQCLQTNHDKLSDACKAVLDSRAQRPGGQ